MTSYGVYCIRQLIKKRLRAGGLTIEHRTAIAYESPAHSSQRHKPPLIGGFR
jgi:hypothetical protein